MRTSEKPDKAKFVFWGFCEVRERFIADSSPVASVSALCNTAAGSKVLSPPYARRREDGKDQPFEMLAGDAKNLWR